MVIEYFMEWVLTAPTKKREAAAAAMARTYLRKDISTEEREDVDAALMILLEDKAPSVRFALAETFGAHARAPRHVMSALATDIPEISVNVLACSPVFHDSELISFIKRGERNQQVAISCRPWLSREVTTAVCAFACRDASYGLLVNPVAEFDSEDLHFLAKRFGTETEIRNILLKREDLPSETRHLLIGKLRDALGGFIRTKSWLPQDRLNRVLEEAGERASIIFAASADEKDIRRIVQNLIQEDRMNVAFLVRALCMGNIALVASAFSELSGVRFSKVEAIISSNRESAFRAVYERAGIPESAYVVFRTAIATWQRLLSSGSKINQSRLPFIVTRDVLSAYVGGSEKVADDLLVLLRKLAAEAARESSRSKAAEIANRGKAETVKDGVEAEVLPDVQDAEVLAMPDPDDAANENKLIPQIEDLGHYLADSLKEVEVAYRDNTPDKAVLAA